MKSLAIPLATARSFQIRSTIDDKGTVGTVLDVDHDIGRLLAVLDPALAASVRRIMEEEAEAGRRPRLGLELVMTFGPREKTA